MIVECSNCGAPKKIFKSQLKRSSLFFCNKSCHRSFKNNEDNPSLHRDLTGENNPMWGKHPKAWNTGLKGEQSHNWRGGIHKRKDGYVRIRVNGKRHLLHRYLLKEALTGENVVHHKDKNPSNNTLSNLQVLTNQAEHARLHATL